MDRLAALLLIIVGALILFDGIRVSHQFGNSDTFPRALGEVLAGAALFAVGMYWF